MSKNEQFKLMVEQMVRREVRQIVPQLVKEVMSNMILESKADVGKPLGNPGSTRRPIQESYDDGFEEYPTMGSAPFDRASMMNSMGMSELTNHRVGENLITAPAITEYGTPVNAPVSEELLNAFNKDYRPLMKAMDKNRG